MKWHAEHVELVLFIKHSRYLNEMISDRVILLDLLEYLFRKWMVHWLLSYMYIFMRTLYNLVENNC